MKIHLFVVALSIFISLFIFSCSESTPPEPKSSGEVKTSVVPRLSKIDDPIMDALPLGWKTEIEYILHHYVANSEFGIMPTEDRQFAGSSGDPSKIQKLNELKSKWGFNYIAA